MRALFVDDEVEFLVQKLFRIAEEDWIGSDDEVAVLENRVVFLTVRSLQGQNPEGGSEFLRLLFPVRHHALGGENEARQIGPAAHFLTMEVAEGLDGLPEPHVVGEDAAQSLLAKELQPLKTILSKLLSI